MPETTTDVTRSGALSIQLNIVTTIDVAGILAGRSVDECVWMSDNSTESSGKGTSALETGCHPGQVLNWLMYSLDVEQRPDGTYPPIARILNIVFLDGDTELPFPSTAGHAFKVYGAPDRIRSPYTPVYAYWAGMVPMHVVSEFTRYRMIIEIPGESGGRPTYVEVSKPALRVRA